MSQHFLSAEYAGHGGLVYKAQDPVLGKRLSELEHDEKKVYQTVADSKTNGTIASDISKKVGLTSRVVTSILGKLAKKNLVRSVKSVSKKNRNVWILYDLEPSEDITGGIWYRDNEFDKDFIDALYQKTFNYIEKQEVVSKKEIAIQLRSSGMTDADLKDENIQSILNMLIYDDKIEEYPSENKANPLYSKSDWQKVLKTPVYAQTPCGTCPLFLECKDGGIVSPQTCLYFDDW